VFFADNYRFEYGKIDILRKGTDVTVVTCGSVVPNVVEAADKLRGKVSVLNVSCPLDLDEHVLREYGHGKKILVVEDHVATLGLTSLLAKFFLQKGIIPSSFEQIAIQEHAVSGSYEALYEIYGLSSTKIAEKLGQMIS
jgi:Transketolase, C-terminal subunit